MKLWNWATDFIINMNCVEDGMELPKGGLIPVQKGSRWIAEVNGIHGPLNIDITDMIPEELYDILEQNAEKIDSDTMDGRQSKTDKHIDGDSTGRPRIEKNASNNDNYKANGPSGGGRDASRGEREAQADNAKKRSIEETKKSGQDQGRGTGRGLPRMVAKDEMEPKVNWRQVLRRYLKISPSTQETYMRPNRRGLARGLIQKGERNISDKVDVVVTCDTSGSITAEILKLYTTEVQAISKAYKHVSILLLLWHTEVYFVAKFEKGIITTLDSKLDTPYTSPDDTGAINKQQGKKITIDQIPYKDGGTTLSSVADWFSKNTRFNKSKILIVFTDGHVEHNPRMPKHINKRSTLFMVNDPQSGGTDEVVKNFGAVTFVKVSKYT